MNKVDFWRGPARPSLPVDMRVPFSELKDIKDYLESHGLAYSVMIKDIQVRSCPALPFWLGLHVEKKDPGLKVEKGDGGSSLGFCSAPLEQKAPLAF